MAFKTPEHIGEMTRSWMNKFGVSDDVPVFTKESKPAVVVENINRQPIEQVFPG